MPGKSAHVKNEKQYEALKDKGMSKERAAKIANSPKASEHGGKAFMDRQQAARQRQCVRRFHRAAADKGQPVAVDIDHAPTGAAQARIDAQNADRMANRLGCHGYFIPHAGVPSLARPIRYQPSCAVPAGPSSSCAGACPRLDRG